MTWVVGSHAASQSVSDWFQSADLPPDEKLKKILGKNAQFIAKELGQLKGTVMKAGQMLSMFGERFLPPEANRFLKTLQSQSPPLEWPAIEKILIRELGPEKFAQIEFETESLASASLGQVHRGKLKTASGSAAEWICFKVQYPGVRDAVRSDLAGLRRIMSLAKLLPSKQADFDGIFQEVAQMLEQETDYLQEARWMEFFRKKLAGDSRYFVPKNYPEFSTSSVLATEYVEAYGVDGPEVHAWSAERRNAVAAAGMELYYRELLEWRAVQTDPHFGNYRVLSSSRTGEPDRLVLFDFGAIREISSPFFEKYRGLIRAVLNQDREQVQKAALEFGLTLPDDPESLAQTYVDLALLIGEPFRADLQPYDWGASDLPLRVMKHGIRLKQNVRTPPPEVIFLDRKMGGIFIFMSTLRAVMDCRPILEKALSVSRKSG